MSFYASQFLLRKYKHNHQQSKTLNLSHERFQLVYFFTLRSGFRYEILWPFVRHPYDLYLIYVRAVQKVSVNFFVIHRFQKKPEVAPKRGLIALAVSGKYSKQDGERREKQYCHSLFDDIPGVVVSEGKIEKMTPSQLRFSLTSRRINLSGKIKELLASS